MIQALLAKGVHIPAPAAVVVEGVDIDRIEAGVTLHPGTTLRGAKTLLRAGTQLGKTGGGYFEDISTGKDVDLYGGYFKDAVFLDGVIARGHAEMRGGTLMEEGSEVGHHAGYKMTITMPFVVAGSLINFCDALIAGGTSRKDHSEVGSCLALYNFTPWGDKFASLFGDVPSGVFLKSRRIFIGGQTQIVSPVHVGYGAVIPAGAAVRRDVPANTLYAEAPFTPGSHDFDPDRYGALTPKFRATMRFIGNLLALRAWYQEVRIPTACDALQKALYEAALRQVEAGISERRKRLEQLVERLPRSLVLHSQAATSETRKRCDEHSLVMSLWPQWSAKLSSNDVPSDAFAAIRERVADAESTLAGIASLTDREVQTGTQALQQIVDAAAL
ncbi:MAG: UDP-N-acetylglucosamine pyrophosphorylase [Deltaproteobacteria bacterium CG_4_9_14_3_um_filter_63_12]|nr:MAG: UDP-N-acetylglucosamine pyrophosphorylase [Deltaproteobacteria bacterium CG17_big_fil_post_rev_8_21_14_2_50_63_7]PJB42624.1 MAG: UDP-N-acetylglucosamine pyrophosphorylase [Deltaproteobacteria bacterium CG_4_9_14_3_um_filter_63_12]